MRLRFGWAMAALVASTVMANAALAPQHQRAVELGAVIDAVADTDMEPIVGVEFVEWDHYRVRYGSCVVDARIVDVPPEPSAEPIVGPRDFEVVLDEPKC